MREFVFDKKILRDAWRVVAVVCFLVASLVLSQGCRCYNLSWSAINSGGGISTGGPYVLTGTIGQPDAGWSIGGKYELLGGFWPDEPIPIAEFEDLAGLADRWLDSGLASNPVRDNVVDCDELTRLAN